MGNDPVNNVDPDGGCTFCETVGNALTLPNVTVSATRHVAKAVGGSVLAEMGRSIAQGIGGALVNHAMSRQGANNSLASRGLSWANFDPVKSKDWANQRMDYNDLRNRGATPEQIEQGDFGINSERISNFERGWQADQDYRATQMYVVDAASFFVPVPKVGLLRFFKKPASSIIIKEVATVYRNFGWNEYKVLRTSNNSFKIGSNFGSKQFWLDKEGIKWWNSTTFSKNFTAKITVNKSALGHGVEFLDAGKYRAISFDSQKALDIFNRNMKIEWIKYK